MQSAGVEWLTDVTHAEFVDALNRVTTRGLVRVLYVTVAVVAFIALLYSGVGVLWAFSAAAMLAVGYLVARSIEQRRRRFVLVYDLDEVAQAQYGRLLAALDDASASHSIRGIQTVESIGTAQRKYHGGAGYSISVIPAYLGRLAPPNVETNVHPYCLWTQGKQLYFFPDRLIILENGRFAAVGYDELEVSSDEQRFQWDGVVPRDAEIIGQTWRYTNKNGGPDRRFADNYAIPIVRTGELTLRTQTGLHICVQTTRPDPLRALVAAIHALDDNHEAPPIAIDDSLSEEVRAALTVFGLDRVPSMSVLRTSFRELAKRNHPDRHARDAPAVREFVEQRMKEINAAFAVLRPLAEATPDGPATSDASPEIEAADGPQELGGLASFLALVREPYFRSPVLGTIACIAIAVGTWRLEEALATVSQERPATRYESLSVPQPIQENAAPTATEVTPSTRRCPLRMDPSSEAATRSWVSAGAPIEILERHAGWRRVRVDGVEGWMGAFCWSRGRRRSGHHESPEPLEGASPRPDETAL